MPSPSKMFEEQDHVGASETTVIKRSSSFAVHSSSSPTAFASSRSYSLSTQGTIKRSQTSAAASPRRLSRKLPPQLTESLLALDQLHQDSRSSIDSTSSSGHTIRRLESNMSSNISDGDTLAPSFAHNFATYTLSVDPPLPQKEAFISHDYTHRRSSSLTPSDAPSVAFSIPSTPSSQYSNSQFRHNWPSRRSPTPLPTDILDNPPSLATCSTASTSCWSAFEDLEASRSRYERAKPGHKESRREKKERKRHEAEVFSPEEPPSLRELFEASMCEIIDEHGTRTHFRDVLSENGKKTIVVFIRHCESLFPTPARCLQALTIRRVLSALCTVHEFDHRECHPSCVRGSSGRPHRHREWVLQDAGRLSQ